jgi:hypothetical protein
VGFAHCADFAHRMVSGAEGIHRASSMGQRHRQSGSRQPTGRRNDQDSWLHFRMWKEMLTGYIAEK